MALPVKDKWRLFGQYQWILTYDRNGLIHDNPEVPNPFIVIIPLQDMHLNQMLIARARQIEGSSREEAYDAMEIFQELAKNRQVIFEYASTPTGACELAEIKLEELVRNAIDEE